MTGAPGPGGSRSLARRFRSCRRPCDGVDDWSLRVSDPTENLRRVMDRKMLNPLFFVSLGLPGVVLWLGGLWLCYTAALIYVLDLPGFEHTADQERRLAVFCSIAAFATFVGYAMIVAASILCGFERYRLPPNQAASLAALDAGQQVLFLLALCQLIMMAPVWGVYDFMSVRILISSGFLLVLAFVLRGFARRKHREWLNASRGTLSPREPDHR